MLLRLPVLLVCLLLFACSQTTEPSFEIRKGEHIAFVGNTFAEQMYRYGFFETLLHCRYPEHELQIRNLGWSADEIDLQPRPEGFGDHHHQLEEQRADLVFACFGLNESFRGEDYLPRFQARLVSYLKGLRGQKFNGTSTPRIVLVSPIAHETNPAHNVILRRYVSTMADIASKLDLRFVDLFKPTLDRLEAKDSKRLTHNGIHLTQFGYWKVSELLAKALGLDSDEASDGTEKRAIDAAAASALRRAVVDKNRAFFLHWRGPNMEYIHGRRNRLPGAKGLPQGRSQLSKIIAQLDARITAAKKPATASVWADEPPALPMWVTPPDYQDLDVPARVQPDVPPKYRIAKPAAALAEFIPADGYKIDLFASEADAPIANPVAMQFDAKGRLWVACSTTWPHPTPGQPPADSIVILEDTDRDGKVDKHTTFVDQLPMIHGFALGNGGAYISQTPDLIFAADTDGDGRADRFETVLHGFGSEDVEHSISNLRWGPDGALYFMEGTFHHTQVETPQGPRRVRDGGLFRFHPRTHRFDVLASYAFWNPWGQAFDPHGQHLVLDASSHDFFAASVLSTPYHYPKNKSNLHAQLSFAPNGLGPAGGLELVSSKHFPDAVQGRLLVNQLSGGFRGTRWFELVDRGTSFEAKQLESPLIFSTDNKCRPLAMSFGPDGALYILDFASGLIENTSESKSDPGRDHAHGRVWRVTYPARPLQALTKIEGASPTGLLDLLGSTDRATARLARRALQEGDPDATMRTVAEWLGGFPATSPVLEQSRLEALWVQQGLGRAQDELLRQVLAASSAPVRAAGLRVLRFRPADASFDDTLKRLTIDSDPRVRLEAVLVCGTSDSPRAEEIALLATQQPMDTGMRHALGEVLDYLGSNRRGSSVELPGYPEARDFLISRMSNLQLTMLADKTGSESVLARLAIRSMLDPVLRTTVCSKLAAIRKTSLVVQIHRSLLATERAPSDDAQTALATMLAAAPKDQLTGLQKELVALTKSPHVQTVRQAGYASLLASGRNLDEVMALTSRQRAAQVEMLLSIDMVPDTIRVGLFEEVMSVSEEDGQTDAVRSAAVQALAVIPGDRDRAFNSIIGELTHGDPVGGAQALFRLPRKHWQTALASWSMEGVFEFLEKHRQARDRSKPAFKLVKRAAFELIPFMQGKQVVAARKRLIALGSLAMTVRVVPHLMLFDKTEIVVKAGERVELTLENPGVMNHNLVLVAPGKLAVVGNLADRLTGAGSRVGKDFVPPSPFVLAASGIAAPRGRATMVFDAPEQPGDYPFLCTIPGHWSRMNGILKVVAGDEITGSSYSNETLVRSWRLEDIDHILKKQGTGKAPGGAANFTKLCSACHTVRGKGGTVGPDLTEASQRMSLREMLEHTLAPSKLIDPKYQIHVIELVRAETVFGRIVSTDGQKLQVQENPVAGAPLREIWQSDVIKKTPTGLSTMPKGLLNALKRRHVLDLMAYIRAGK